MVFTDNRLQKFCTGHKAATGVVINSAKPEFKILSLINGAADGLLNAAEPSLDQPVVSLEALNYTQAE